MNIYIDESGSFIPTNRPNYVNCVVGLIIPTRLEKYLFDAFLHQRTSWGSPKSEIKGSKLDEKQVALVLKMLRKYDVLAEICGVYTTDLPDDAITDMKQKQADGITENITPQHHPNAVAWLQTMRERTLQLPNPLYLQSFALTQVICDVIRTCTGFWAQRDGTELGNFKWMIDAKDKTVTEAEDRWENISGAHLQTGSLLEPGAFCDAPSFDYSHFEKFVMYENSGDEASQRHMRFLRRVSGKSESAAPMSGIDIKALFADLKFANSNDSVGLQLADIVASAFHRAFKGTLQKEGWKFLGPLFVNKRKAVVNLLMISQENAPNRRKMEENAHVLDVLATLKDGARSMMVEDE